MNDNANVSMYSAINTLMTESLWGKSSSVNSLIANLRSEVQEFIDACKKNNSENIKEEASDILMIVMCLIYMDDHFETLNPDELALRIVEKLRWRYGHLFSNEILEDDKEEFQYWENAKAIEKKMQLMFCDNTVCEGFQKIDYNNIEFKDNRFCCKLCGKELVPSFRNMLFYRFKRNANKYFQDICEAAKMFYEGNRQAAVLLQVDHPESFRALSCYLDTIKADRSVPQGVIEEYLMRKFHITNSDIQSFFYLASNLAIKMKKQDYLMETYYTSIVNGNYLAKEQYTLTDWRTIRKKITQLRFDIEKKIDKINGFQARSWDNQVVQKYLLKLPKHDNLVPIIECMSIMHYVKQEVRDLTIELSNMYNCIVGCRFCASGNLPGNAFALQPIDYLRQLNTCIQETGVDPNDFDNFFVSFAGIGEPSFVFKKVTIAMVMIRDLYPSVQFNIATFGYLKECFDYWNCNMLPIRTIQIPLYHIDTVKLKEIIKALPTNYDLIDVIQNAVLYKKGHPECRVKINYIPFKGVNDSDEDVIVFINALKQFKDDIVIKISYLNYTKPAEENGYVSSGRNRLIELNKMFCDNGFDTYIFGTENNTEVGCGQLSQNHISDSSWC